MRMRPLSEFLLTEAELEYLGPAARDHECTDICALFLHEQMFEYPFK
jgi:hypothetical protein